MQAVNLAAAFHKFGLVFRATQDRLLTRAASQPSRDREGAVSNRIRYRTSETTG
jgi:hypothetical protein